MAINPIGSSAAKFRIGGLATGLDTDQIVKDLMSIQKVPLNKLYQKRQLAEWKRDDYRSITNLLRGLKDEFLDVLKPSTNMLSQSNYKKFTGTSSASSIVTVSGSSEALASTHTISVISLAAAGKAESGSGITDPLQGSVISDYNLSGKKLQLTLDGITREISLDNYSFTAGAPATSDIVSKASTGLQALVDTAFGAGKISVNYDGNTQKLTFNSTGGAGKIIIAGGDAIDELGFAAGATNRIDINQSLDTLKTQFAADLTFNAEGKLNFTINSETFTFDKSVSLSSMINTINSNANAKINMKYDEASDKFIITSKQVGAGDNIIIDAATQEGNFFGIGGASGINTGSATTTQGTDASARIDGQLVTRSSNTFTLNGVTYTLNKAHTDPNTQSETVSLSLDTDGIFNNIKSFIDKYNEVISTINSKLVEKYDRDYQPLTDEQKVDMEAEDIKKWEDKAKTGLLRNDQMLQDIVTSMRRALSDGVADIAKNLSAIGITTGSYVEKGKLIIDETKLKAAISNDSEAVMQLFTKQSDISYSYTLTSEQRSERYSEEGLAYRLSDILADNIRTVGGKGRLLEKAGIQGDITEFRSTIYTEISAYNTNITKMLEKLADKEDKFYEKYAAMEKAISRMNSQSSWLSSQFSSNS